MALRYLIGTGDVSDPTKWDGGVSVPGSGDDCYANGFTGTISADFTVNSLNTTASGAAAGAVGTQANGGTHVGDSYGGGVNTAYGTRVIGGGYQYGQSFGGSAVGSSGSFVDGGGICITTGITNSTGAGLTLSNDGAVILQASTTLAQVTITAAAGRYRVDRGISSVRPFIRPPVHPAFVS